MTNLNVNSHGFISVVVKFLLPRSSASVCKQPKMSKLRLVSTVLNYRFKNTRLFRAKIPCQKHKAFPLHEGKNNTKQQGGTITFVFAY